MFDQAMTDPAAQPVPSTINTWEEICGLSPDHAYVGDSNILENTDW